MTAHFTDVELIPAKLPDVPLDHFLIRQELPELTEIVSDHPIDNAESLKDNIALLAAGIAQEISTNLMEKLPAIIESVLRKKLLKAEPEPPETLD